MVLDQSTVTFQKGWGRGLLQFVAVLDQSTVIFQKKGGGITICVVLDQNHGNVRFYQLVSNLHPRRFS